MKMEKHFRSLSWIPPMMFFGFLVALVEGLVKMGWVSSYLFPAPSQIAQVFWTDLSEIKIALCSTLFASLLGLILSGWLGITFALLMCVSPLMRRVLLPYSVLFQTVPIIAIAPLLVIWFGFGQPTVVACAFIVSFFPILANAIAGFDSADPHLLEWFQLQKVGKFREVFLLRLPSGVPQIVTGAKVAAGLSLIGAIVGEFISGSGLGGLIDLSRTQQRIDKVFACVGLATLLGIFYLMGIELVQRTVLKRWTGYR